MGIDMDTITITGVITGIDNTNFILETGDNLLTVVIPHMHEDALEKYQALGLTVSDTVTVEGLLAEGNGEWHESYCGEEMTVDGEHLMAFTINGMEIFSFEDMSHHGSRGMGYMGNHDVGDHEDQGGCH
jgi:hypothetical protein